jgi:transcriptional regulator with GAF, ATPase, and Fis domain
VHGPTTEPEFESLTERLLEVAQIRSAQSLLQTVVSRLAERPHIALARIWLVARCDRHHACRFADQCHSTETCLHLAASDGGSRVDPGTRWTQLDGEFQRVPLGFGSVGQVASRGHQVVINDAQPDYRCFVRPDWARAEGIRGFNGQPIIHQDQFLGVLAIYTWVPVPALSPVWLRIFADHIAAALVNARAFEEIEQLKTQLELENSYLRQEVEEAKSMGAILGQSRPILQLIDQINMVAPTDATVLILGESGTGKELVAHEIHRRSQRASQPLIRVNCASVPRELYESEFFGHAKGAFTGAIKDRAGRFEAADGGSLFLDEIGEIPPELQGKFLRVLQERQYERVGEERTRSVNVRLIAATNRNLQSDIAAGRFRQDLFYRLNVFPITVPPLRDRPEDIPLLASHFVQQTVRRLKLPKPRLSPGSLEALRHSPWPGNVRELQNVVERAVILAQGGEATFPVHPAEPPPRDRSAAPRVVSDAQLRQAERDNLIAALTQTRGKIEGPGGAAQLLGVRPTTLKSRLKALGLSRSAFPPFPPTPGAHANQNT